MTEYTVSVVMPAYNHAAYLPEAVSSVASQLRPTDELIVIDDASTDTTPSVLIALQQTCPQLKVITHQSNRGCLPTSNEGAAMAKGDLLMFSAADDRVAPGGLERLRCELQKHPSAAFVCGLSLTLDKEGRRLNVFPSCRVRSSPGWVDPQRVLLLSENGVGWVLGNTVLVWRNLFLTMGGFPERMASYADSYLFMLLACRLGAVFVPDVVAEWRRYPEQYSAVVSRDIELAVSCLEWGWQTLSRDHSECFPGNIADSWYRAQLMQLFGPHLKSRKHFQENLRHYGRCLKAKDVLDKVFLKAARVSVHAGPWLFLLYRFLRLTWRGRWWLIRGFPMRIKSLVGR